MTENLKTLTEKVELLQKEFDKTNDFFEDRLLKSTKQIKTQKLIIICITIVTIVSMLVNFFTIKELVSYKREDCIVETYKQNIDGENNTLNNIKGNQYNDNAIHNEGGE